METKTAIRATDSHLVSLFATPMAPVGRKQEPALVVSMPAAASKPAVSATPAHSNLPLFMEPVFKAKEHDPL